MGTQLSMFEAGGPGLSSVKLDWCTPACVLERVLRVGPIALDPCTNALNPCGASVFYTEADNAFLQSWETMQSWETTGLIYVNPPYGRQLHKWVSRVCLAAAPGANEIIMLTPARPDTVWWGEAFDACQAVALWRGRLTFVNAPASAPFPSCLFYFGERAQRFKRAFEDRARVLSGGRA
jgi:site-specific DNA-methyltransferase (adenine-specific)